MTIPKLSLPYSLPLLEKRVPRCGQHRRLPGNEAYTHLLFVLRPGPFASAALKVAALLSRPRSQLNIPAIGRKDRRSLSFCPLLVEVHVISSVGRSADIA